MDHTRLQHLVNKQQQVGTGCILCLVPIAIAAIVIALKYDPSISICGINEYMIDLKLFLFIAGGTQLGFSAIYICILSLHSYSSITLDQSVALFRIINAFSCLFIIFYLIWSGIGCYIYKEQMNEECKSESISVMILSWSIIQFALFGVSFSCIICGLCCVGAICGLATLAHCMAKRNRNGHHVIASQDSDNLQRYMEQEHNEDEVNALVDKVLMNEQDQESELEEHDNKNKIQMPYN